MDHGVSGRARSRSAWRTTAEASLDGVSVGSDLSRIVGGEDAPSGFRGAVVPSAARRDVSRRLRVEWLCLGAVPPGTRPDSYRIQE